MQKTISLIVPVYKTEEFIIRCLTSLVKQNIAAENFEIIVVIDGSPDNSLQLVTQFANDHPNIKVIEQGNMGLSEARNNGYKIAEGKYIWFIDSDDWIADNCLSDLLRIMEDYDLDMFDIAPSIPFQQDFKKVFNKDVSLSKVLTGKERLLTGNYGIGAWAYIFKKNFLDLYKLSFLKNVYYEDEEFTPRALFYAERVMRLNDCTAYSYFIRENSITTTISKKTIFDKLIVAKSLEKFMEESINAQSFRLQDVFQERIIFLILSGINKICAHQLGVKYLYEYLANANKEGLYPFTLLLSLKIKTNLLLIMWNLLPSFFYKLKSLT